MPNHKSELLERLALARRMKEIKRKQKTAPPDEKEEKPTEVISSPSRELAKECADHAMIAGWGRAIQKVAYEHRISEDRMREILDDAAEYNDRADPSGRIEALEDWKKQKRRPQVEISSRALRPS